MEDVFHLCKGIFIIIKTLKSKRKISVWCYFNGKIEVGVLYFSSNEVCQLISCNILVQVVIFAML